ncbi:MAG TPA: FAD-binding oxidoreductase [Candidatus Limnocylindria bacterium]|nr:FAD-binding oxidoreductase [Candidatus Limnocylindria bacterium]
MAAPDLTTLRPAVSGRLVLPHDDDFEDARRVWNGMIDRRPLGVVRAVSIDDIPAVLELARREGLALAIRGGGHNVAGNGTVDGGLVLDLGALNGVEVDPRRGVVRVGPGATLVDVDRATEEHALIVPLGVVSATGVAGLTLGGGFGWLTRSFGLAVDNLLQVDLVTADGRRLTASETDNSELFWGLRGGGGNFGVATAFTFQAQRLGPQVFAGNLVYRRDKWADALRAYADWTAHLPDELTSIVTIIVPPPAWELGDETVLLIGFTWTGADSNEAMTHVDRLTALAPPDERAIQPNRWVEWQSQADDLFPRGARAYWKNVAFDQLSETAISAVLDFAERLTPGVATDIHHMEGAFGRVPEDATAFPGRSARYWLNIYGFWQDPAEDEARVALVRGLHAAMGPVARPVQYVNFAGHEGRGPSAREAAVAAYGPQKFERLVELKRRYDPTNLFRLNHNIPPD